MIHALGTIMLLLLMAGLNAFAIIGFREAVWYDYKWAKDTMPIGWRLKYYGDKWLPGWICKPLYNCCTCMASLHSIYVYWPLMFYLFTYNYAMIWMWGIYVLALAGIITFIYSLMPYDTHDAEAD